MKTFTAKEAKTHFGEFLDAMQREPVMVTKNNRPVGYMVSVDDPRRILFEEDVEVKSPGYDEWYEARITKRLAALEAGAKTYSHEEAMAYVRQRTQELAAERAKANRSV